MHQIILVYNEQTNQLGLWAEGWNLVLFEVEIVAYRPKKGIHRAVLHSAAEYGPEWQPIEYFDTTVQAARLNDAGSI